MALFWGLSMLSAAFFLYKLKVSGTLQEKQERPNDPGGWFLVDIHQTLAHNATKKDFLDERQKRHLLNYPGNAFGGVKRLQLAHLCRRGGLIQLAECNPQFIRCGASHSTFSFDRCPLGQIFFEDHCALPSYKCRDEGLYEINARTEQIAKDVGFCAQGEGIYTVEGSKCSRQAILCKNRYEHILLLCTSGFVISIDGVHCVAANPLCATLPDANGKSTVPITAFLIQRFCERKRSRFPPTEVIEWNQPCRSWYIDCRKPIYKIVNCQRGSVYDSNRRRCIHADAKNACTPTTPAISCSGRLWESFALEPCSRYFFYCEGAVAREYVCATGLVFHKGGCVSSALVPQCKQCRNAQPFRSFDDKCDEDCTRGISYRTGCGEYMKCESNGRFIHGSCPPLHSWDIVSGRCVPDVGCGTQTDRHCQDGEIIESRDCVNFFYCSKGAWSSVNCWSTDADSAVLSMGCGSCKTYADGQTLARSECIQGMTVRDRWSCNAFARCTAGHWEWRQCTAPLLWSVIQQSCVTDSECEPSLYGPVECLHGTRVGQYDTITCNRYFECIYGSWRLFSCPTDEVFDAATSLCVSFSGTCSQWLENSFVPVVARPPYQQSFHTSSTYSNPAEIYNAVNGGRTMSQCVLGSTIRDDYDCAVYYICTETGFSTEQCPLGTTFNAFEGTCDNSNRCDLSRCMEGSTRSSRFCGHFSACEGGKWVKKVCNNFRRFMDGRCQGDCDSAVTGNDYAFAQCDEGEVMADDRDCTLYFVCSRGYFEQRQCKHYAAFDPNVGYCRNGYKCSMERSLSCYHNEKRAIPNECSKYLSCVQGTFYERKCPPGHRFSTEFNNCFPGSCDIFDDGLSIIASEKCNESGGLPGYRADPYNCQKFYQCAHGRWVSKECPAGLAWNSNVATCDWPRNVPECNFG
uniref:Chitin-binding type-2 domain-containing protein n=1 Tax=Parascaris univalens TaxID=6257 RepID=A0A915BQ46_PARUN